MTGLWVERRTGGREPKSPGTKGSGPDNRRALPRGRKSPFQEGQGLCSSRVQGELGAAEEGPGGEARGSTGCEGGCQGAETQSMT